MLEPAEKSRKMYVKKVKSPIKKEDEGKPPPPFEIVAPWDQDERFWEVANPEVEPLVNVFTCGWTEDGRCGYPPPNPSHIQNLPRPVYDMRQEADPKTGEQYVCRMASAGSKHSVFVMTNCRPVQNEYAPRRGQAPKKAKCIMLTGLNQLMLCEEPGFMLPQELVWEEEEPWQAHAGNGNTYVITKSGKLFSFGQGKFGMLGHCEERSSQVPRQVLTLKLVNVKQLSVGQWHVVALSDDMRTFSWGRNHVGQLGRGHESIMELVPDEIAFLKGTRETGEKILQVGCGGYHSFALIELRRRKGKPVERRLYMWGDNSRGQCGNADEERRSTPQENAFLATFLSKQKLLLREVVAGGWHNLAVTEPSGQIVSWGAGDHGQLGHGGQFDELVPRVIGTVKSVVRVAAGLRHSMALCDTNVPDVGGDGVSRNFGTSAFDLWGWGSNSYGELGLGDTNIRLNPTKITAFNRARVLDVACGDRHTIVHTCHKPMVNTESHVLKPYFSILADNSTDLAKNALKIVMKNKELDPDLLDAPDGLLPDQPGEYDDELKNDPFEKGLRYCMDSTRDPTDWRRAALECAFECITPTKPPKHLRAICLACSRHCQANARLVPYARRRTKKDYRCDCRTSGMCQCTYSVIRGAFDDSAGEDFKIGPNQLRELLATLRKPEPVEKENMDDCLAYFATAASLQKAQELAEQRKAKEKEGRPKGSGGGGGGGGDDDDDSDDEAAYDTLELLTEPRIGPIPFEKWYREYFDVLESDSDKEDEEEKAAW
jgi:hypothetical protein